MHAMLAYSILFGKILIFIPFLIFFVASNLLYRSEIRTTQLKTTKEPAQGRRYESKVELERATYFTMLAYISTKS